VSSLQQHPDASHLIVPPSHDQDTNLLALKPHKRQLRCYLTTLWQQHCAQQAYPHTHTCCLVLLQEQGSINSSPSTHTHCWTMFGTPSLTGEYQQHSVNTPVLAVSVQAAPRQAASPTEPHRRLTGTPVCAPLSHPQGVAVAAWGTEATAAGRPLLLRQQQ
jgi:hypothetical protein